MPSPETIYKILGALQTKGMPPIARPPNATSLYALFVPEKPTKLKLPPNLMVVDAKEVLAALR